MDRLTRKYMLLIGTIICVFYLIYVFVTEIDGRNVNRKLTIDIMEQSIRSLSNQQQCRIPQLAVNSPEMLAFIKNEQPIECGNSDGDWVKCEQSTCFIKNSIARPIENIDCNFTDILRINDYVIENGVTNFMKHRPYRLKASDFVRVECANLNDGSKWSGILAGIRETEHEADPHWETEKPLNVLMFGLDSLSRNAFIRKLPKTYKYLVSNLSAHILQGYNIIGDGTPQALIPILTGFTELELPETRRRVYGSTFVDTYPMIWKEYESYGYATAFNEDVPDIGTFTYRLNGFREQPTTHYMRTFYLAIASKIKNYARLCVGHQPRHTVMLDYTKELMLKYKHRSSFVFSFHGELSHDSINLVGVADNDLVDWLNQLKSNKLLENTILIFMSDHGNRFAAVRNTLQGKQEERLPFFSFAFPHWFLEKYPRQYANFKQNTQRLTTPFDIHATLQDILRLPRLKMVRKAKSPRAISLFDPISANRSCADAYIEAHWCACLNWTPINNTNSPLVRKIGQSVMDLINNVSASSRLKCAVLKVDSIVWASKLIPHNSLVRFKQTKDDDGMLADLSSQTAINVELYQIKVIAMPGRSIFEASVAHYLTTDEFHTKISDVSRVNAYGDQAKCILDSDPELRKFCYCK